MICFFLLERLYFRGGPISTRLGFDDGTPGKPWGTFNNYNGNLSMRVFLCTLLHILDETKIKERLKVRTL